MAVTLVDGSVASDWGFLAVVPPLLTLGLALATRNILLALGLGAFSGTLILSGGQPFSALLSLIEDHMFVQVADPFNAQIIFTMMAIGGFIHLLQVSGGAQAFATHMAGAVHTPARAQLSAWSAGIGIFFSDVGNPLIVGPLFRPVFDGLRICREKLAYVLDCTSAPVCILVPFIGWGTYISGLIEQGYRSVGRADDGFQTLLAALPFQFYAILTLIAVPIFALRGRDLGPMRIAQQKWDIASTQEQQEHLEGLRQRSRESAVEVAGVPDLNAPVGTAQKVAPAISFLLPIGTLLGLIGGLLAWHTLNDGLHAIHVRSTLFISYLAAAAACGWVMWRYQQVSVNKSMQQFVQGAETMVYVSALLVLAWSLGAIIGELGTGPYLARMVDGSVPAWCIPAIAFLLGAVTSFATGSSWGTFAILMVIALPVADALDASLLLTVAAVLSGGLFGDHTSPISDTTVLAAMGAECEHVDHVTTQLPYALIVGGVSFVAYLLAALVESYWVLGGAVVALLLVIFVATNRQTKKSPAL